MIDLTPKQKSILKTINKFIKKNGYAPSRAELAELTGYRSPNGVQEQLVKMEAKGAIKLQPIGRGIVVL